jgi:hypothetical protein
MAAPRIRSLAFYYKGKKAVTVNKFSVKYNLNRSAQFGHDEYLAHAEGIGMVQITCTEVVTVSGSTTVDDLENILFKGGRVKCSAIIGGRFQEFAMTVTDLNYESDSQAGTATGNITLEGALPTGVTG